MTRLRALPAVLLVLTGACTAGPDYARPGPPASAALSNGAFLRSDGAGTEAPLAQWWTTLEDPELTRLVELGISNAPRIAAATARVEASRAALGRARADRLPNAGPSAMIVHAELPDDAFGTSTDQNNNTLYAVGFDARWEADLWGAGRRGVERRMAESEAAEALLADAQVQLSAEIARTYVDLREAEAKASLLGRQLALQLTQVAQLDQRRRAGTLSAQPAELARQQLEGTRTALGGTKAEVMALRDGLAVLTGSAPGALDDMPSGDIPLPPASVDIGDPGAMLARRPDLRAAERRLAAANAKIGVAEARRLPSISILGLIGIGGTSTGDLFDSSSISALALPQLSWRFLDFGLGRAEVRGATAGRDEALAEFQAAQLEALRDAEASLARFGAARSAFAGGIERSASASRVARLEGLRADAGTLPQSDAIEAQVRAIEAQTLSAARRAALTRSYIALAKSLGLGWQSATAVTPVE